MESIQALPGSLRRVSESFLLEQSPACWQAEPVDRGETPVSEVLFK